MALWQSMVSLAPRPRHTAPRLAAYAAPLRRKPARGRGEMFSARTSDVAQGGALTRGFRHSHRAASSASQTIAWRWPSWRLPAARAQQSCQPETVCPEHSSLPYCNARLSFKTITAAQKTIDNQLQTNKYFRILKNCMPYARAIIRA